MQISVLTAAYPTREEHSRGTPIWNTLGRFYGNCEFTVNCSRARAPMALTRLIQPRSYFRYPGEVDTELNPRIPARTFDFTYIPRLTRGVNGLLLARAYRRRLLEERPDVALAYPVFPEGYAAVRAARQLGIPAVIGSRGSDLKLLPPKGLIRRHTIWALRNADAVLCVSADLVRIARELGARSVHLVRNGVNADVFFPVPQDEARRKLSLAPGEKWIAFTGHLIPVKGISTLLRAIAKLRDSGDVYHVALIGEGRQEAELRSLAGELGIEGQLRFAGQLKPTAVAEWVNAADLFCLPSLSEGMPNAVLEALACGRAVVATDVGGIPELVGPRNGILVAPGDPDALAAALRSGMQASWDREAISREANWSWEKVAAETLGICRQVSRKEVPVAQV